ncbi:MAG: chemotaxis protein [Rhodospirillaceae bacterium]|jgi:Rod binding domain-containing protein|nr:chemotaxis protein [Rhodospirillaceae bacterium]|tara:strand:- start:2370 stop:2693 length:324 start_codon:yes stop_codon:yes gene_type:complete
MMDNALLAQGATMYQSAQIPPQIGRVDSVAKAREVGEKFEAFFLGQMLQPMFANIDPAPPFGGGAGDKIWKSMMVDEIGKSMAKSGGIGLADTIQREILRMQEVQNQ